MTIIYLLITSIMYNTVLYRYDKILKFLNRGVPSNVFSPPLIIVKLGTYGLCHSAAGIETRRLSLAVSSRRNVVNELNLRRRRGIRTYIINGFQRLDGFGQVFVLILPHCLDYLLLYTCKLRCL